MYGYGWNHMKHAMYYHYTIEKNTGRWGVKKNKKIRNGSQQNVTSPMNSDRNKSETAFTIDPECEVLGEPMFTLPNARAARIRAPLPFSKLLDFLCFVYLIYHCLRFMHVCWWGQVHSNQRTLFYILWPYQNHEQIPKH